jgi:hypothetical protein
MLEGKKAVFLRIVSEITRPVLTRYIDCGCELIIAP